jgi:hypothetical protein
MKLIKSTPTFLLILIALIVSIIPSDGAFAAKPDPSDITKSDQAALQTSVVQSASGYIYKYLVHRNTGGPVACGDTLYPVYVGKRTGNVKQDIAIALKSLFSTPGESSGLFNPLSKSKLKVSGVEYNAKNIKTTIRLSGKLVKPDNYCDIARARAMVWATAQQFPEVRHATIFLGSALLGDLLAAKERAKP